MPGNLLSIIVGWLATHLVFFGFLGYLCAGLFVAGVIDWPPDGGEETSPVSRTVAPAPEVTKGADASASPKLPPNEAPAKSIQQSGPALPAHDARSADEHKPESPRKAPRLIGGTIPVYEDPRFALSAAAPSAATKDAMPPGDPFRPSVAESGGLPFDGGMTRDEFVQRARRAYWNGDFEAAEAAYMEMLSAYPGDADAFGELGNLYQSMGRSAQALDAYYEAGLRLKAGEGGEKLQEIIELLQKEGDSRSDQLRQ
jgi:hypothetical protein